MDHQRIWQQQELEDQLKQGMEWDEYDPEQYGWENSRILSLRNHHSFELSRELGPTSVPHKTRVFLDNSDGDW